MRDLVVEAFVGAVDFDKLGIKTIAVVAGSDAEPELALFRGMVSVWGIEEGSQYLDLNCHPPPTTGHSSKYDLVISSQALEHVWNHRAFFENLFSLCEAGGYIWIGCPTSNFPHNSPSYYSAGFTAEYLEQNARHLGLEIIHSQVFSSRRNYIGRHAYNLWLTYAETKRPLRYLRRAKSVLSWIDLARTLGFKLLNLAIMSESRDLRWGVESALLCRAPISPRRSNGMELGPQD